MEVAPGIRRIGGGLVNVYLVEEAGEVTIVDAGAQGYWHDLPHELAAMGRSLDDVRAVVLTHAHTDHTGFAERIRRECGVPVRVHADDAALARREVKPVRDPVGSGYQGLSFRAVAGFVLFSITHRMTVTAITEVGTFLDGATLDVPGSLRVIHVPGHTAGSAAFHLAARDAIFVGDAFVTRSVITGRRGPHFHAPFNADQRQAVASLARLDGVEARIVLPGHGDAWTDGLETALAWSGTAFLSACGPDGLGAPARFDPRTGVGFVGWPEPLWSRVPAGQQYRAPPRSSGAGADCRGLRERERLPCGGSLPTCRPMRCTER